MTLTPAEQAAPDAMPLFRVTVEISVVAKDHDDAERWTDKLIEQVLCEEAVVGIEGWTGETPEEWL